MLLVEATRFGAPRVLTTREVPDLAPGPGQVVVRTSAADVLFVDTAIRAGRAADFFPIRPPYVPGNGVAGCHRQRDRRLRARGLPAAGRAALAAAAAGRHAALESRTAVAKTLLRA